MEPAGRAVEIIVVCLAWSGPGRPWEALHGPLPVPSPAGASWRVLEAMEGIFSGTSGLTHLDSGTTIGLGRVRRGLGGVRGGHWSPPYLRGFGDASCAILARPSI